MSEGSGTQSGRNGETVNGRWELYPPPVMRTRSLSRRRVAGMHGGRRRSTRRTRTSSLASAEVHGTFAFRTTRTTRATAGAAFHEGLYFLDLLRRQHTSRG